MSPGGGARDVVRNFNISIFQGCCKRLSPASIYIGAAGGICRGGSAKKISYIKKCVPGLWLRPRPAGDPGVCAEKRPEVAPRYIPAEEVLSPCNFFLRLGGCAEVNTGLPDNLLICGEVCESLADLAE